MVELDDVFSGGFEYSFPFVPSSTYKKADEVNSPIVIVGRCPVGLCVCPQGSSNSDGKAVSVFLCVCPREDWKTTWEVSPVDFEIEVMSAVGKDCLRKKTVGGKAFNAGQTNWGFKDMIPCTGYNELKAAGWVFADNTIRFRVMMKGNSWQQFQPRLLERDQYAQMWHDMKFPDMHVCVGGSEESMPCHRAVLATASHVFDRMLSSSMKEGAERRLVLPEVPFTAMRALIEYLYTGYISEEYLDAQVLRALLPVADQFELPKLVGQCAKNMVEILSPANACGILALLRTYRDNPMVAEHFATAKQALYKDPTLIDALLESVRADSPAADGGFELA